MKIFIPLSIVSCVSGALAQTLAPSPTESIGCEPHDDHWHCDGPVSMTSQPSTTSLSSHGSSAAVTRTAEAHDDDDHDHESGTGTIAPSPTESVGCEPHGNHWHCDGPAAATLSALTSTSKTTGSSAGLATPSSSSTTETTSAPTAAAGSITAADPLNIVILIGCFVVAIGL